RRRHTRSTRDWSSDVCSSDLLELIRTRPRNAKVFCIGVGNDVNRPLLEQMAQDAGGLSAFLSRGDNFARQAQAFRRKLTRPVAKIGRASCRERARGAVSVRAQ